MRSRKNTERRCGLGDEQGATLVEFAFGSILLFTLLFGIVEFGLAFKDRLTVSNATQSAARVATGVQGTSSDADILVLDALEQALGGTIDVDTVSSVWIYEANDAGEPVDPGGPTTNKYTYIGPPDCRWDPCPDPDHGGAPTPWLPSARSVDIDVGLTRIGVRVNFKHDWITGLLGFDDIDCPSPPETNNCWAETSVLRMEPQR